MISLLQEENISFNNNSLSTDLLRSVGVPKHTQHRPQEFRWGKNKRNVSVLEQEQGLWKRVFICCSLLCVRLYTPTDLKSSVGAKIKEMFCLGARTRFMKEGIYFVALAVLGKWYLMTSRWRHHHNIWVRLPATPVSIYGKWHKHLRVCQGTTQGNYIQKDSNVGIIYYYILFIVEVKSR